VAKISDFATLFGHPHFLDLIGSIENKSSFVCLVLVPMLQSCIKYKRVEATSFYLLVLSKDK